MKTTLEIPDSIVRRAKSKAAKVRIANVNISAAEAKPGEAFCKIGVGALSKIDDAPYSSYVNYPILNGGKRSVKTGGDFIEFTQEVDCGSGYAYAYSKTIRLLENAPVMTIAHRLVNRGVRPI